MRKRLICNAVVAMLLALLIGGLVTLHNFGHAWAEDGATVSMFVSPMSQKILLVPGERFEGTILISNGSSATGDLNFSLEVGAYNRSRDEGGIDDYTLVNTKERTGHNIMMDWITLNKKSGVIHPNSQEEISFTIDVPKNAPAGAQYASILVSNEPNNSGASESDKGGATIKDVTRMVSAIIANVAGQTVEKGSITDNSFPSFLTTGPLEATSMVRNDGNIYTDAEYILQVWPAFSDEEICTNEEKPDTNLVLPDTERYYMQQCNLPMVGIFRAKQTVKIFGEVSTLEKTIVVCPLWLMFLIVFVIILIIMWLVLRVKSRKEK